MDRLCLLLRGTSLSKSLRQDIWRYKYLSRGANEAPSALGTSVMRELSRLSSEKGYSISSERGYEKSNMKNIIK